MPFENDSASDVVYQLEGAKTWKAVEQILDEWSEDLDIENGEETIGIAVLLAASYGRLKGLVPDKNPLADLGSAPRALIRKARRLVERILHGSALKRRWGAEKSSTVWTRTTRKLAGALKELEENQARIPARGSGTRSSSKVAVSGRGTYRSLLGSLSFSGNWSRQDDPRLANLDLSSVWLNPHSWTGKDLAFLEGRVDVRELYMRIDRPVDLSALATLTGLERLAIGVGQADVCPFDFSKLRRLKRLVATWNAGFTGLEHITRLESLEVTDLRGLATLDLSSSPRLHTLRIADSDDPRGKHGTRTPGLRLKTLRLSGIKRLRELTLWNLDRLEAISGFASGGSIRRLELKNLRRLDPRFFRSFTALEDVSIFTKDKIKDSDFGCVPARLVRWSGEIRI